MLKLDVGTLAFSSALVALVTAATIVAIGGRRRRDLPWIYFAASGALYGLGVLLIILRPPEWVFVFVTGGNALVLLSTLAAHAGVCIMARRKIPLTVYGVTTLGLVLAYWIAHVAFPTINLRIVLISLSRLPFFLHGAVMLHGIWRENRLRSTTVLSASFLGWVGALLLRVADVAIRDHHIADFLSLDGYQAFYFILALLSVAALGIAVLLMDAEREEAFLGAQIRSMTADLRKAKDAAEMALGAKSRFLAATGHDLRQAVHALRLLLTAAADGYLEDNSESAVLFDEMDGVIGGMTEQLNALLEMARLEAGAIVPSIVDCSVETVFKRVEQGFGRSALANEVDFRFVSSSLMVRSDPALLTRILANLVANGIKFTPGGRVLVGCRRRGDDVHLLVCDDGVGIPADKTEEIFEEYRQLHNPARQQLKGLGLGLAIVKRMADLLGHGLSVSSRPGRGTIFAIRIPAAVDGTNWSKAGLDVAPKPPAVTLRCK
ncbi:HAMP domain-containing sensor histidine kinase [Magnetospirillum sp. 15-1]|uniref:sensor histidine kinase n=1 Tax=Magnetospirillum sp. 15-1 TaxID=1979370 RepID=UPI000BBC7AC3|nr:HAMP domain-containing sensor histidine kinase [Magnetospirillum sp. 15-1]